MKIESGEDSHGACAQPLHHVEGEDPSTPRKPAPRERAATAHPPTVVNDEPDPGATPAFRGVGFTLSSLGYAVARRFRETLAPLELEPREFALLRAVGAAEGQTQQAIGERLQIPPSRMVAFVDALEARSLLERRHNPDDRRTRELFLTDAGRDLLTRAFALASAFERSLCADLAEPEREQLLDLLARVGATLGLAPAVHAAHVHAALAETKTAVLAAAQRPTRARSGRTARARC